MYFLALSHAPPEEVSENANEKAGDDRAHENGAEGLRTEHRNRRDGHHRNDGQQRREDHFPQRGLPSRYQRRCRTQAFACRSKFQGNAAI